MGDENRGQLRLFLCGRKGQAAKAQRQGQDHCQHAFHKFTLLILFGGLLRRFCEIIIKSGKNRIHRKCGKIV